MRLKHPFGDWYTLALLLLIPALIPLFGLSTWVGAADCLAIYGLAARLASKDLDTQPWRHIIKRRIALQD